MRPRPGRHAASLSVAAVLLLGLSACGSQPGHSTRGIRTVSNSNNKAARPTFGERYVVARGDTLFSIAFRNQLDYHELADWNGIGRDYTIYPGQVLRLTAPDAVNLPPAAGGRPQQLSAAQSARTVPAPVIPPQRSTDTYPKAASSGAGGWEWPTRGKVVRAFDANSSKGIDIGGTVGQIVVASRAGTVVYSGSALKGYGELIIIKHDEDSLSAYGYNRRRLVEEGEKVGGGQPIAELGLGPEQRPLLHFEIRDRGKPVDPKPLLPRR